MRLHGLDGVEKQPLSEKLRQTIESGLELSRHPAIETFHRYRIRADRLPRQGRYADCVLAAALAIEAAVAWVLHLRAEEDDSAFGRPVAEQELTLAANAEMLEGFCQALGLEQFDVVANDTGGAVAQALAVRRPDLIRSLTLTNCEARDVLPSSAELAQLVANLAEQGQLAPTLKAFYDDREATRDGVMTGTYQWPERFTDDDIRGIMEPHQASLEAARKVERFMRELDSSQLLALEPELRELEVPTHCVWGTGDDIFPLELAYWLRDAIPGCDGITEIKDGKLFWPFERGAELASALRKQWASVSPQPANAPHF